MHGKTLRRELHQAGFQVVKRGPTDVIIAHSGGCYLLDERPDARLILLVGLPYWPGVHPSKSVVRKILGESKTLWWFKKLLFSTIYIFAHPLRWYRMHIGWKNIHLPTTDIDTTIVAVRNKDDHFSHPAHLEKLAKEKDWKFNTFDSHHDDIWVNPKPYVELISKELK